MLLTECKMAWEREEKTFFSSKVRLPCSTATIRSAKPLQLVTSHRVWGFLVFRPAKKDAKRSRQEKEKPRPRRRLLMSKPVDDVYLAWLYRRPSYQLEQAVGMLKRFQELDFTHPKQFVYINVFLDMALQKKVGWERGWEFWCFWISSDSMNCEGRLQPLTSFTVSFLRI